MDCLAAIVVTGASGLTVSSIEDREGNGRRQGRGLMSEQKTIVFFPEAAFGPALNSFGIAQACQELGHRPVFVADTGMAGVFAEYGFEERPINMSAPMPPEEMAKYWSDFINGHIPNFSKSPYDQIDNYVKECWEAIVETAVWAEKELPQALDEINPDLICIDNVVLFPATKRHGVPWVRIISCSENEIEDPDIPPYLSGCAENDHAGFERFRARFHEVVKPTHDNFNAFLASVGHEPYPLGEFFETSPYLNLLLYPEPVRFKRRNPLDPARFQYLDGCVREMDPYDVPGFAENDDKPLLYVSFGSLGAGDTELLKRIIAVIAGLPYRALVNVGDYLEAYAAPPPNVHLASWYPQPSVLPRVDAVIHHGGNNSFTECLYFAKPALILPYVWDGHDNATRVQETGHGLKMHRSEWSDAELAQALETLVTDKAMHEKLAATSAHMQAQDGRKKAARLLDGLLRAQA
jgi:MGT family glycosyltransferase